MSAGQGAPSSNKVEHASAAQPLHLLESFQLAPGFHIELVASEPMVSAPAAMAFDENGRLFVAEMRDYPDRRQAKPHLGRIRVLESPDEHGVFQSSTIFAEDLPWPSAIACYGGGVFVATTPDVLFLRTSTEANAPDLRRVVFSGFGGTNAPNPEALLNNFNWGLDNRIYGGTAGLGGTITVSNWPGAPVELGSNDFSFDPRSLALIAEAGPAQSGVSFDNAGRKFSSSFDRPLSLAMYEPRYFERDPFYPRPPELLDAASPGTPIVRYVAGAPGTNSLLPGRLVRATACVIYRGNAFPTNYSENAFVADADSHIVHRFVLRENGLAVSAETPPREMHTEFLVCKETSFNPVQIINGPDGALYIADMQQGGDRGRIYRIVPEKFNRPKPPQLGKASTYELVGALANSNGWTRDTAARLLFERRDSAGVALLSDMLRRSRLPLARLHALHALAGGGALKESQVLDAMRDSDPRVRERAVLLAERFITNGLPSEGLWSQLRALAADPAIRVRQQLAFTAGNARRPDRPLVLAQVLNRDPANVWIKNAIFSSLGEGAGNLFLMLAGDPRARNTPGGLAFLRELAILIGTKGRLDEAGQVVNFMARAQLEPLQAFALLTWFGEGLHRTHSSLALVDPQGTLQGYYAQALNISTDGTVAEAVRIQAVRLLAVCPYTFTDTGDWLLLLVNPLPLPALRLAAIDTLCGYNDPRVLPALLERWASFPPAMRSRALNGLLMRSERIGPVMDAITQGRIPLADLDSVQLNFLRTSHNGSIRERAERLFGPVPKQRPPVVEQFKPALRLKGAADHGRQLFNVRCAACHGSGPGQWLGPDLEAARGRTKEWLLSAILQPSAQIEAGYATKVLQTREDENFIGITTDENPVSVTLRQRDGLPATWPRLNVLSTQTQSWSLMPDGLEQGLTTQDMADLLEFLSPSPPRKG